MNFTILGASGFVGRNLVKHLRENGYVVYESFRKDIDEICKAKKDNLGHVIYCIGTTANFRKMPLETVDAHVCTLIDILKKCEYESFTYLSSTRVYINSNETHEDAMLRVQPSDPGDIYNISKLMGESICLSRGSNVKVVRLSNVYGVDGSDSFLNNVINDVVDSGHVTFKTSPHSCKDYISINDVVALITSIVLYGKYRIYNVARGSSVTNLDIAIALSKFGYDYNFSEDSHDWIFPEINIERISQEFKHECSNLLDDIGVLLSKIKLQKNSF